MSTCSSGVLSGYSVDSSSTPPINGLSSYRKKTQEWWMTNSSRRGSNRVFETLPGMDEIEEGVEQHKHIDEDLWDLTDSVVEMNETRGPNIVLKQADLKIKEWIDSDSSHGFIRVYSNNISTSVIVPCTLSTTVRKIASMLTIQPHCIFMQLHGDIVRRLYPDEYPLSLQNEYLMNIGYTDTERLQEEGTNEDLNYLIRFSIDRPYRDDGTFTSRKLRTIMDVRKGRFSSWQKKYCTICGTRMTISKSESDARANTNNKNNSNNNNNNNTLILELVKGRVDDDVKIKGRDNVIKLTTTIGGEKTFYLSFKNSIDFLKWLRKLRKATIKLPTKADLSNSNLETLPGTIFHNDHLRLLNLRHNVLIDKAQSLSIVQHDSASGAAELDNYYSFLPSIGYIEDLTIFTRLSSLNLADNRLIYFPDSLCHISTLVELNLASNRIESIPDEIGRLRNLKALHLHNNLLRHLPDSLVLLCHLFCLVLANNRFSYLPPVLALLTDIRCSDVEKIFISGNQIRQLSEEVLGKMKYAKVLDLRMNKMKLQPVETFKWHVLEQLTHLDIRDNYAIDLDLRCVKNLQSLRCERNRVSNLQLSGNFLREVYASNNSK